MTVTRRGPTDPRRRERIIDAVVALIVDVGVRGVTHRRVATAAAVPLAATTYYFASLDDMIEEGFAKAVASDAERIRTAVAAIALDADLPLELARIVDGMARDRAGAVLASELGVFALRSERGSRLTAEWIGAWTAALAERLDVESARMAVLLASVLIQGNAQTGSRRSVAEIEALLRRGIYGPAVTAAGTSPAPPS